MKTAIAATALILMTPGVAMAADKVPVTVNVTGCDNCSIMATWSKDGTGESKYKSSTKKVKNGTVSFQVPKGYWMYLTGTSPQAGVNAATIVVTQYLGSTKGAMVSTKKSKTMNEGAHYCLKAKKSTINVKAAFVKADSATLLSLWANPQLAARGRIVRDGIKGVYGTQNTLICKGKYY